VIAAQALLDSLVERGVEIWAEGDRLRYRAPEGILTSELRAQLREHRDEILASWRERQATHRQSSPLSWTQLGLWLTHEVEPNSAAYNVAFSARIVSALDVGALRSALQALADRHEALRTVYLPSDPEPLQVVLGYQAVDLEQVDATGASDAALHAMVQSALERPFDLTSDPMMRARLFSRADDAVLLLVWHHIATDGWSVWIQLNELRALYMAYVSAAPTTLPPVGTRYADYARQQRDLVAGTEGEALFDYWKRQLAGCEPLNLVTDRIGTPSSTGRSLNCVIDAARVERLKALAADERASLFVVLLAAFKALLYRYTAQTDLTIGAPTFGRSRPELQDLVGDLVNTVALRTDLSGDPPFRELVSRVRATVLGGLAHADYPFALLVRRLGVLREAGRSPIFDVFFNFQTPQGAGTDDLLPLFFPTTASAEPVQFGALSLSPFPIAQQEGQFDLALEAMEMESGLAATFKYRTGRFDRRTIGRLVRDWRGVVEAICENPDARLSHLARASGEQQARLLGWTKTAEPVPGPLTLHGAFEDYSRSSPQSVAVCDANNELTYGELNRLAATIAGHLERRGVRRGARVAIAIERSVHMIAAVIGTLKAGAAYVPLDPAYPPERLAHMLRDSRASVVLTERSLVGASANDARLLYVEDCLKPVEGSATDLAGATPDDVAYVIYTSGSTGGPKGVVIPHRAAAAMLHAYRTRFGLAAGDRWIALTTLSFDPSVLEIFGTLGTGGCLFVPSRADVTDGTRLRQVLEKWRPNFLQGTPSTYQLLLDAGWVGDASLTLLVGGEALTHLLALNLLPRCCRLFNVYGPTETTMWATAAQIVAASEPITLGRPLANVRAYVLDAEHHLVPVGVAGELWIGGEGVAIGYFDRESLTCERFLADPFRPGGRMYRTGDLARWRPNGDLEYLGRLDHQVKLRGHRIELGEIENALERHPAVRRAVVTVQQGPQGPHLVAYVTAATEVVAGDVFRFLRDSLPGYMVPSILQVLDEFPLTPSGKINRRQLPVIEIGSQRAIVPASTEFESALVRLWEEVLDIRPIGVTDNFFELGGHSLLATRLCARIAELTRRKLHVAVLLQSPTISDLARRIEHDDVSSSLLVPVLGGGTGTPFFCVPGGGDNAFIFADLAKHLSADRVVYSFRFPEIAAGGHPRRVIADVAARLLAEMRAAQPTGPYLLGGYCFGGLVAFEMARQLRESGDRVASLTIFEMYLPGGYRMQRLRDRVEHQVKYMRSLDWPDRVAFLGQMTRRRIARTGRRWRALGSISPDADYSPQHPFVGRLTLFRAQPEGDIVVDPAMGWRGLAAEIVSHEIAGHHTNAYKEPHLSAWIDLLRETLARADGLDATKEPQTA
jgi:amino acid adenylation domain-containing protein